MDNFKENNYILIDVPEEFLSDHVGAANFLKKQYPNFIFCGSQVFNWLKHNPNIEDLPSELKISDIYLVFFGGILNGENQQHKGDMSMSVQMLEWNKNLFQFRGHGSGGHYPPGSKAVAVQKYVV